MTALALAGSARAVDVTGKWDAEFTSAVGPLKYTYTLKSDGTNVTGKALRMADAQTNETDLTEGKVDGTNISFVEALSIGDQDVRIEYKGTVDGDTMNLTRSVGDFGSTNLVATREKAASIAGKWLADFDTQVGHQFYTYQFNVDGDKLTGDAVRVMAAQTNDMATTAAQTNDTPITEGKVSGDDVSFVETLSIPNMDQPLRIEYKGKISGDEIKLTRSVGDFATEDLVAKRATDTK